MAAYRQSLGIFTFQEKPTFVALRTGHLIMHVRSASLVIGRNGHTYIWQVLTAREEILVR